MPRLEEERKKKDSADKERSRDSYTQVLKVKKRKTEKVKNWWGG